jgi:exonuclease VII small subunit
MSEEAVCTDHLEHAIADLEKASAEVHAATNALRIAEQNLEHAEVEVKNARENPHAFKVSVFYNGLERDLEVKANELIKDLLARAIAAFGSLPNPHMLSLFTEDGRELKDEQTVREAGLKPCEKLLLRPGAVKGGQR